MYLTSNCIWHNYSVSSRNAHIPRLFWKYSSWFCFSIPNNLLSVSFVGFSSSVTPHIDLNKNHVFSCSLPFSLNVRTYLHDSIYHNISQQFPHHSPITPTLLIDTCLLDATQIQHFSNSTYFLSPKLFSSFWVTYKVILWPAQSPKSKTWQEP